MRVRSTSCLVLLLVRISSCHSGVLMNDSALTAVLKQVEAEARKAGDILLSYHPGSPTLVKTYKQDGSFATQADLASEKYLVEVLTALVPGAGFYAEETGIQEGNDYQWVIDPLDGTTNFAHGLPHFCVSIALTYKNIPMLGVVYAPVSGELFSAQRDHGAFLNGERLTVSRETELRQSLVVLCNEDMLRFFDAFQAYGFDQRPHVRDYGASALDAAYCAAGRFNVCLYQSTKWWDIAAGSLLIEEAGGTFSTLAGGQIGPEDSTFIGGNKPIFAQLFQALQKAG